MNLISYDNTAGHLNHNSQQYKELVKQGNAEAKNLATTVLDKYLLYESKKKKNNLLTKYNKPLDNTEVPTISNWYDSSSRKYTKEFLEYCSQREIDFIIWAFSDFGIYFFSSKLLPMK